MCVKTRTIESSFERLETLAVFCQVWIRFGLFYEGCDYVM